MEPARFEIRDTPLGKGLFATHSFEFDDEGGVVDGQLIDDPDYGSDYCIALDGDLSIEPGEPFRYLNHSCEPNCELVVWEYEDSPELDLLVYTLRPIQPGEQLTIDYGWPADAAIACLCGSEECRGWIVATAELNDLNDKTPIAG